MWKHLVQRIVFLAVPASVTHPGPIWIRLQHRNYLDIREKSETRQIMHTWDFTKYMAWITFNRQPEHSNTCLIKNRYLTQEHDDNHDNHTQTKHSGGEVCWVKGKNCRLTTAVFTQPLLRGENRNCKTNGDFRYNSVSQSKSVDSRGLQILTFFKRRVWKFEDHCYIL